MRGRKKRERVEEGREGEKDRGKEGEWDEERGSILHLIIGLSSICI